MALISTYSFYTLAGRHLNIQSHPSTYFGHTYYPHENRYRRWLDGGTMPFKRM